jgi:hypothetical protein
MLYAEPLLFPEDGQFWVGVIDDGIPRPSCKKSAQKGEDLSPECLSIDKGCPQMVISSSRDVLVLRSPCDVQVGYICHLGSYALLCIFYKNIINMHELGLARDEMSKKFTEN